MGKTFETIEERRLYNRRHYLVNRVRGKAREHLCEDCGGSATNWATNHDGDPDLPDDYRALCGKCHVKYDKRWTPEERAKVAISTKAVWDNSPERRLRMSLYPHRLGTGNADQKEG